MTSTSFILFNSALNTFYLQLYGISHMVKIHSERGNLLLPHGLLFPISSKGSFKCTQDSTYHSLWYTRRGALAGTRNATRPVTYTKFCKHLQGTFTRYLLNETVLFKCSRYKVSNINWFPTMYMYIYIYEQCLEMKTSYHLST